MDMNFPHEPRVQDRIAIGKIPRKLRPLTHDVLLALMFDGAFAPVNPGKDASAPTSEKDPLYLRIGFFASGNFGHPTGHPTKPIGSFDPDAAYHIASLNIPVNQYESAVYQSGSVYFKENSPDHD